MQEFSICHRQLGILQINVCLGFICVLASLSFQKRVLFSSCLHRTLSGIPKES